MVVFLPEELNLKTNKFIYLFGLLFVVGALSSFAVIRHYGSSHTPTTSNTDAVIAGKKLVFDDEFNGSMLNSRNWATCYDWRLPTETGCTNAGNFEHEWYTDNQLQVRGGNLVITAKKSPVTVSVRNHSKTFEYQSGMINSGRGDTNGSVRWAGTYGYYEARIKFQKGKGIWPAFWLLPVNKQWPPEIDAMEFVGSKPNQILQTVHWKTDGKAQKSSAIIRSASDYSGGWHTYGVDWEPNHIDWYIDGKKTRSYTGPDIPSTPMEVIVDLAVGGLLPGDPNASTPFPNRLLVDYIRVYQTPGQASHY